MQRLIVYGAGELGGRVAARWAAAGHPVLGYTAGVARHADLRDAGVLPRLGSPAAQLERDDALLLSLPGHESQGEAVALLAQLPPPRRAVLISSVGVYGKHPHGDIDEGTPPAQEERAQSILEVEKIFQAWVGDGGIVLRCGGLYRPGRGPISALARRGFPRPGPPNKTLALVHYDDAAAATSAALQHESPRPLYNVVTPPCPTRRDFYTAACAALALPPPAFTEADGQLPAIYNVSRLRRDLLADPAHPSWRDALETPE